MINYTFTKEDVEMVEKFIEIKNRRFYCDGVQLTEVYNRVLHKHVTPTQCGSCLRQRVAELETALNHFKSVSSLSEASKPEEPATIPEEENKAVKKAKNDSSLKPAKDAKNKK